MSTGTGRFLRLGGLTLAALLVGLPVVAYVGFRLYCGAIDAGGLYRIPSSSMEPTLHGGDYFVVLPHTDDTVPDRGTVIVYRNHNQGGIEWVKRVIALPGERVAFQDGVPIIDGTSSEWTDKQAVKMPVDPHNPPGCPPGIEKTGDTCLVTSHLETFGAASHRIVELGESRFDNTDEVVVPVGHVFVAGDNRDNSVDSRLSHHGFVPVSAITGVAWRHHVSFNAEGSLDIDRIWRRVE